jgi:hypothetical protein
VAISTCGAPTTSGNVDGGDGVFEKFSGGRRIEKMARVCVSKKGKRGNGGESRCHACVSVATQNDQIVDGGGNGARIASTNDNNGAYDGARGCGIRW